MKTIMFNGYIDTEVWFGDEVTPQMLHDQLYEGDQNEDVTILIHSYGGSCDAAVSMFEDIRNYPGHVTCQVQVAASAATVVAMAGNKTEMSPVGIFMIHRPLTFAYGNEDDLQATIDMLRAYMNSIVNAYAPRCEAKGVDRDAIIDMMKEAKWMDANEAMSHGFIDSVSELVPKAMNAAGRVIDQEFAKGKYDEWIVRDRNRRIKNAMKNAADQAAYSLPESIGKEIMADLAALKESVNNALSGKNNVSADQLYKRLNLLKR